MVTAGVRENSDLLIPDSGLLHADDWGWFPIDQLQQQFIIRSDPAPLHPCARDGPSDGRWGSRCSGIRLRMCTANGQGRILGKTVFGTVADRSFRPRRIDEILGLTRG